MFLWAVIALGAYAVLAGICAAIVAPSVWSASKEGRTSLIEGSAAVVRKDADAAAVEFKAARDTFDHAAGRLRSPLTWPLRLVPIVSTHVRVGASLADIGSRIASAGVTVTSTMRTLPKQQLTFTNGKVDLRLVRTAHEALVAGVEASGPISSALREMPTGWVGGPLAEPRRQALDLLPSVLDGVRKAEAALGGLPSILAETGTKRYLVAFSNLSELRGSGGLFGYVTALKAHDGDLDLEALSGRPTQVFPKPSSVGLSFPPWFPDDLRTQAGIFQNINMSTDFPTVGHLVLQTAEPRAGPLDGVIAVDPVGIGAILGLTGPIHVATWPGEIDAKNVAQIAMHDVYIAIPKDDKRRQAFFSQLVRTAFDKLTSTTIRLTPQTVGVFDGAVRGGNFRMFSDHAEDESVFARLGAAGNVSRARGATDVLSVVSENATGSKGDWYLRRDIRYVVRLDPDTGTAATSLSVGFRNTAPAEGLPDYVIGSFIPGLPRGTDRQIVVLLRSPNDRLTNFRVDDKGVVRLESREGALSSYRSTVDIPAHGGSQVAAVSVVPRAVVRSGNERVYRLHVLRQAVANPDFADIDIQVPSGWRAVGRSRYLEDLGSDVILEVHLSRTMRASLIQRVVVDPWQLVKHIFARIF